MASDKSKLRMVFKFNIVRLRLFNTGSPFLPFLLSARRSFGIGSISRAVFLALLCEKVLFEVAGLWFLFVKTLSNKRMSILWNFNNHRNACFLHKEIKNHVFTVFSSTCVNAVLVITKGLLLLMESLPLTEHVQLEYQINV